MEHNNSGSLNPNDIATLSLLSRPYGPGLGYGYGHGYGHGAHGYLSAEALANGTATNAKLDANSRLGQVGLDRLSDSNKTQLLNDQFLRVNDNIFRGNLLTSDKISDVKLTSSRERAEIKQNIADCCCEIRKEVAESKSETLAAIAASESRAIERDLNKANAKITQLETVNMLKGNGVV